MTCLYFWWLQNTGKELFEKHVKMISALRNFLVILYITAFSSINNFIIFKHLKFDDHTTTLHKTCWDTKQKSVCFPVKMAKMETISKWMAIFPNPLTQNYFR